ncbi:hypothetical protein ALC60_13278, partial [Trachymyrmex zeteki]
INMIFLKELKVCLRELAIIDDTLESLGTSKRYQRLNNWIIRIIIGWIVYVFFCLTYINFRFFFVHDTLNFTFYLSFRITCIIFPFFYPIYVIILSALISATILGYTSSRFHQVNNLLRTLYSDVFKSSTDDRRQNRSILVHQRTTGAKDHDQYIWIIM